MGDKTEILKMHESKKDEMLKFYEEMNIDGCKSCSFLLENVRKIELDHLDMLRQELFESNKIDLSHSLALTPLNEMQDLKNTFRRLIEFKENSLKAHFEELDKIAYGDTKDFLDSLKKAELSLHDNLKIERNRMNL